MRWEAFLSFDRNEAVGEEMKNLNSVRESFIRLWAHVSKVSTPAGASLTLRVAVLFLTLLLALPLASVALLLRPIVELRFWPIYGDRLGHLVIETDILVSRLKPENPGIVFVCFFVGEPANSFYAELLRRKLLIVPPVVGDAGYLMQRIFLLRIFPELRVDIGRNRGALSFSTKWVEDSLDRSQVHSLLSGLGLESDCSYVCMWVRDSRYGAVAMGGRSQYFADYRDVSIRNYHSLCRLLDSRGFKVIRMGRLGIIEGPGAPLPYTDYLSSSLNSEENDFLLAKYCSFAICGDSGSVSIPLLYRKPIALTNVGSFVGAITSECIRIVTMKRIEWVETGLGVSSSDIKHFQIHEFDDTKQFEALGIRHFENTERELEGVGVDMLALFDKGDGGSTQQLSGLQASFRHHVRDLAQGNPRFMAGNVWLENNPQFGE